ncbi:alkaline phosphatase [Rhizoctonia solani]|uniref:Alkaline phosphatase n=1 Tax=Rhizoctonia solani TaxID=456999 RepID=A0A8H8NWD1_9AGAM|nr:alkaline phosphatase [Rhizoctonia solani]QRW21139.1 alkaline phosphatase [Rhizoctonia solani]
MIPQSPVKFSYAALVTSALWAPLVSCKEHQLPGVAARQASSPSREGMEWATKTWRAKGSKKVRNLILTIPDGFGPALEVFARDFVQWNNTATGWNCQLGSDKVQIGSIRTRSTDSYVTDSSASATAYSCAIKTYNGAVGIDKTGILAQRYSKLQAFASHIYDREAEPTIAEQIVGDQPLGRVADLLLGGGLSMFWPNTTTGSSRKDGRDLLAKAKKAGFNVFTTRTGFDALKVESHEEHQAGIFHYDQASRIDHAAHANDPVGHLHEIIMYNEVVDYLREWVDKNQDTVMIGTAITNAYGINDANSTEIAVAKANKGNTNFVDTHIGQAMGRRAMIKWGTGGHTAVDVNLIGYGPNIERMAGNRDNTEVGQFITDQLGLDLPSATNLLNIKRMKNGW